MNITCKKHYYEDEEAQDLDQENGLNHRKNRYGAYLTVAMCIALLT